jgi:hypothetical protein
MPTTHLVGTLGSFLEGGFDLIVRRALLNADDKVNNRHI